MKVHASVPYNKIRKAANGLYVWLDPNEDSLCDIGLLLQNAPFKTKDCTELHCTVIHAAGALPDVQVFPADAAYSARAIGIDVWQDHKDRTIAVLRLQSEAICALHEEFVELGFKHGYHEYNPHITIGKAIELDARTRMWISAANDFLATNDFIIDFCPEVKGAPIAP